MIEGLSPERRSRKWLYARTAKPSTLRKPQPAIKDPQLLSGIWSNWEHTLLSKILTNTAEASVPQGVFHLQSFPTSSGVEPELAPLIPLECKFALESILLIAGWKADIYVY